MSNFNFEYTELSGAVIVTPKKFGDDRGFFMELYRKNAFHDAGITADFVQDNCSRSTKGVLRGLHFQKTKPQGKLVRVNLGSVLDVAVDLRPNSPTFGQHKAVLLTAENSKMFYVPEGFAHGFYVLSDIAEFSYKCTNLYDPSDEGGVIYNDKSINIDWQLEGTPSLSDKDSLLPSFSEQDFSFYNDLA